MKIYTALVTATLIAATLVGVSILVTPVSTQAVRFDDDPDRGKTPDFALCDIDRRRSVVGGFGECKLGRADELSETCSAPRTSAEFGYCMGVLLAVREVSYHSWLGFCLPDEASYDSTRDVFSKFLRSNTSYRWIEGAFVVVAALRAEYGCSLPTPSGPGRPGRVTPEAGLLAYRELDDALGLSQTAGETTRRRAHG